MPQINAQIVINNGNVQTVVQPTLPFIQVGGFAFSTAVGVVTSVTGTTNQITAFPTTGAVVLSLPNNVIFPGTWQIGTLGYSDTNILWSAQSSVNSYNQVILQNTSSGAAASTNFNVSNDQGTASTNFGEFGMNSSGFTGAGVFNQPGYVYLASATTDLAIGTYSSKAIHFVINSGTVDAFTINTSGQLVVPAFNVAGVVHNSAAGILSSSLITTADIGSNVVWLVGGNTLTGTSVFGDISVTGFRINFQTKATTRLSIDGSGNFAFTQGAQSSSWGKAALFTPAANTSYTAATEFIDYDFALDRNLQWLAGTTVTQRQVVIRGVTLTGASATAVFTNAYSFYVDPPLSGTNATITNSFAAGFNGRVQFKQTTTTAPIQIIGFTSDPSSPTEGEISYNTTSHLAKFYNGTSWVSLSGLSGLTATRIPYATSSTSLGDDSNLNWDNVNHFLAVGNAVPLTVLHVANSLTTNPRGIIFEQNSTTTTASTLNFRKSRGTFGSKSVIVTGDSIGNIAFDAYDGAAFQTAANIVVQATGTISSGIVPGKLLVNTTNSSGVSSSRLVIDSSGNSAFAQDIQSSTHTFITITQSAHTGGSPVGLSFVGGSHTTIVASEVNDLNINLARTVQFAGSTGFATQRAFLIQAPTYSFVSATGTITDAATVVIVGTPNAGTNATITNAHGLLIQPLNLNTTLTNTFGLTVNAMTSAGTVNHYSAQFLGGKGLLFRQGGQTSPNIFIDIVQSAHQNGGGVLTGINYVGGAHTSVSGATETPDIIFNLARTVSWTDVGVTTLTTQRAFIIQAPTYSIPSVTVTDAATFAITGAPIKVTPGNAWTLTNTHAFLIQSGAVGAAINSYGLTVNAQTGATNNFAAQFKGGNVLLAAGTTTYAPLNIPSGTLKTTPATGDVENDGTNYFVSISTTRYTLAKTLTATATLDFPSTAASSSSDLTITVTGAALNDAVVLGVPNGSVLANSCFTAWVSSANTVTVRYNNYDAVTAHDPASGTYRVSVLKYT